MVRFLLPNICCAYFRGWGERKATYFSYIIKYIGSPFRNLSCSPLSHILMSKVRSGTAKSYTHSCSARMCRLHSREFQRQGPGCLFMKRCSWDEHRQKREGKSKIGQREKTKSLGSKAPWRLQGRQQERKPQSCSEQRQGSALQQRKFPAVELGSGIWQPSSAEAGLRCLSLIKVWVCTTASTKMLKRRWAMQTRVLETENPRAWSQDLHVIPWGSSCCIIASLAEIKAHQSWPHLT